MRQLGIIVIALGLLMGGNVVGSAAQTPVVDPAAASQDLVARLIAALEAKDLAAISAELADDVALVQPMTFGGGADPEFVVTGRAAVLAYLETVFTNFSQIRFVDPVYTVNADGSRVVVETRGDFVLAESGQAYQNIYVFRFEFDAGRITFINEYANPVTASAALGVPLGTPPPVE